MVALPAPFNPSTISALADVAASECATADIVSLSPFRRAFEAYAAAGYDVIPVVPGNKTPGQYSFRGWKSMDAWPSFAKTQREKPAVLQHWKGWPEAHIGIILGTEVGGYQVIAVDVDTPVEDEQDLILSQIPDAPMRKQAQRGFTLSTGRRWRSARVATPRRRTVLSGPSLRGVRQGFKTLT